MDQYPGCDTWYTGVATGCSVVLRSGHESNRIKSNGNSMTARWSVVGAVFVRGVGDARHAQGVK
jgi:hypothetical protein